MAGVVIHRGNLAIVPDKERNEEELRVILAKLNEYQGIVVMLQEVKQRSSIIITVKELGSDVWQRVQNLLDDIGENLNESINCRSEVLPSFLQRS